MYNTINEMVSQEAVTKCLAKPYRVRARLALALEGRQGPEFVPACILPFSSTSTTLATPTISDTVSQTSSRFTPRKCYNVLVYKSHLSTVELGWGRSQYKYYEVGVTSNDEK